MNPETNSQLPVSPFIIHPSISRRAQADTMLEKRFNLPMSKPISLPIHTSSSRMKIKMKHRQKRRITQITLIVGGFLVFYCFVFLWRTPSSSSKPSPPKQQLSQRPLPPELLNNLSLDEDQCDAAFPGLTKEIDDAVAEGPFNMKKYSNNQGPLQGRIKDGQIYIIHAQRRKDLSAEMSNSRTASLHQLNRALLTSPSPLPDTIFTLNFQDTPFGTAWAYSRPAGPILPSKTDTNTNSQRLFLIPHFSFWSWPLPFIRSLPHATTLISQLESTLPFSSKIPKAVWRGTSWFNSILSPQLRQNLIQKTAPHPDLFDVQKLEWTGKNRNATNALPIQDFCQYKYVIHTEGISYSGRFQFLQMCRSVVITPPILWMQHTTHLVKPVFSGELTRKKWEGTERVKGAWGKGYKAEEANIVFVKPDWSDLEETVRWLEENQGVAEGIATRQRELFVGGGYFSKAAETCYWRALVRGWAKVVRPEGGEEVWHEEGVTFEEFSLTNSLE
ncbi:glycosyl transferase family 90-domain-containing protein [Triangularia setosa]|uniref:Glycosyl transferase family 90-domain-containing protein n=1 Tax=Triangularia setosa TaxID=2587417 RepID=A0AAN6W1Y5_9PEZI|nr:glycosyl transferase family 90-domain-containing protein [Podospora setosa]